MGFFGTNKKEDEDEDDEQGEDEEIENYCGNTTCDNCGSETYDDIPIGTTIKDFFKDKKCEDCGCNITQPNKNKIKEDE